jgi:small redox-active disulfide protein 2
MRLLGCFIAGGSLAPALAEAVEERSRRSRPDARQWQPYLSGTGTRVRKVNMDIKVLGTGCANCRNTIALIEQVAREKGVSVTLSKVEELREIMGYGVMSTPGVVLDGKVVHAGGVPSRSKIEEWFAV